MFVVASAVSSFVVDNADVEVNVAALDVERSSSNVLLDSEGNNSVVSVIRWIDVEFV